MTPVRSPKPINRRVFLRNIFATAVSEQKQDEVNSSDPDIFEFTDENNSSNAVDAVSENRNAISRPSLLRNLFSSPVSENKKNRSRQQ